VIDQEVQRVAHSLARSIGCCCNNDPVNSMEYVRDHLREVGALPQ